MLSGAMSSRDSRFVQEDTFIEDGEKWLTPSLLNGIGNLDDIAIDPVVEKRLVRKIDLAIVPLFMILYTVNFLDRSAVGESDIRHKTLSLSF